MKKAISIFIALIFVVSLCSCGASKSESSSNGYYQTNGKYYSSPTSDAISKEYSASDRSSSGESMESYTDADDYSRKLIKTQYMYLETLSFDAGIDIINRLVGNYGGYYSSTEISNGNSLSYSYRSRSRTAEFTVRVPSAELEKFISDLSEQFNVLSSRLSTEEVTDTYYNLKAQLNSLLDQEARLIALEEKAGTLQELLTIDSKLTEVRSSINYVSSRLQYYDKAVDMSFVYITLYEVEEYEKVDDPTYGERVGKAAGGGWVAFAEFMGNVFVVFLWALPFILTAGVITAAVVIIVNKTNKKKNAAKEEKE